MNIALTFDDFLLEPQCSEVASRDDVDLSTKIGHFTFTTPIISSPMDTVTTAEMAVAMSVAGGLGIIHRGQTIESQTSQVKQARLLSPDQNPIIGGAVGVSASQFERAKALMKANAQVICVDVCHGHHVAVADMIKRIKDFNPYAIVIAGNVGTLAGAEFLAAAGADAVRVGIGNGSICSTRLNTGHGVPQAHALSQITDVNLRSFSANVAIISDGGHRNTGDIAKAFGFGADMVMLGSMLSGTSESPGLIEDINGQLFKSYRGMASREAQEDWSTKVSSVEGIAAMVPYKGSVHKVLDDIKSNLRGSFSYSGADSLTKFKECAKMIQISRASVQEGTTHILEKGLIA